jgi:uncharacterized membrane protein YphA (DoxX/SURF4 family)
MSAPAQLILRIGVAFAFLYPAISAISTPESWVGYFPPFLLALGIPSDILLHGFGVVEVVVALWLLSGWRILVPAVVATVMLLAIVVFNLPQMEVLFRDISIAAASLALAVDAWGRARTSASRIPSTTV